jgi:hypothetical protein
LVLFLQHVINALEPDGRCGIVVDEGVLFQVNRTAFVQTKRKAPRRVRSLVHRELARRSVRQRRCG